MRKSVLTTVAAIVCLGAAGWASAQPGPRQGRERPDGPPIIRPETLTHELNLSDTQTQQVKEIFGKARTEAQAATEPQAKRKIWQAATEKMSKEVLNDEQRTKFAQMQKRRGNRGPGAGPDGPPFMKALKELNLTQEQKARVKEIMESNKPAAGTDAEPAVRRQAHEAAMKQIRTEVLTNEQRQHLDKIKAEHPRRGPGPEGKPHKGMGAGDRPRGHRGSPASQPV